MYKWRTKYNMAGPMLPEERFERIERKVEFLVEEGTRLDNRIAAHQVQIEKHSEQIADLGAFLLRLAHSLEDFAKRTEERLLETGERLNILIGIVGRYFSR